MEGTGENWESILLAALKLSCAQARSITDSSGVPKREARTLAREEGELVERGDWRVDWKAFSQELSEAEGLVDLLSDAVGHLDGGSAENTLSGTQTPEQRVNGLWSYVRCSATARRDRTGGGIPLLRVC